MTEGVLWALVAAVGFGLTQVSNRKANQVFDAYRTAFGMLLTLLLVLVLRAAVSGELRLVPDAPLSSVALFTLATLFHFVVGWTLLALSQQRIGVARTGALVSAAPLAGSVLAAIVLDEPLTSATLAGVVLAVAGVALISLSGAGNDDSEGWANPWLALTVAGIWGATPLLIRGGLEQFDYPVLALTLGLGVSVPLFAVILTVTGAWRRGSIPAQARRWMIVGGLTSAVAVSAQWISFDLTTIAIAITVQQLGALVAVALVPVMFKEPFERMNLKFGVGVFAMLAGSMIVVLGGR